MFGEEDNMADERLDAIFASTNLSDMFSEDYFDYSDYEWKAGMLDMLIIETNARLLQYY